MTADLRRAVAGLLSFAAAEEQALLAADGFGPGSGGGSPDRWAAVPLVAHNNQFKRQQTERIRCLLDHRLPPAYGEIDHSCEQVYRGYRRQPPDAVLAGCRRVSAELADGTWTLSDEDLLDPARHPWLNGRLLWLQIVVRGFWHPGGHLGDYYLAHDQAGRAVAMQAQGLAMARTWPTRRPPQASPATTWPAPRPGPGCRTRPPGRWPKPSRRTRTCGQRPPRPRP